MSLYRFVYYSGIAGGWAALLAWMLAERLLLRPGGGMGTVIGVAALVGAAIGGGLNLASGMANARWQRQLSRLLAGFLAGGIGGALGGLAGNLVFLRVSGWLFAGRTIGWTLMGLAIGAAGGICDKSRRQTRNGALGGAIGGLLGGLLFDPLTAAGSGMAARATAFVILGVSIGALVGLAQLVLKEAWLTVVDGYRPGREWILGRDVTTLGRGDHLPLPFLGYPGRDLESEHARIVRQPDGAFLLEDNHSRLGTRLNGRSIQSPAPLADGDLIKIGSNIVRFNSAARHGQGNCPRGGDVRRHSGSAPAAAAPGAAAVADAARETAGGETADGDSAPSASASSASPSAAAASADAVAVNRD